MTVVQLRRGSTAEWVAQNPILAAGEQGHDTSVDDTKIGDGITTWLNLPFIHSKKTVVNVKNYGAMGDGVTDDYASVKAALDKVPAGGTLYFPPGKYFTAYASPSVAANWLTIDKNGITLEANPGSVTLDNFLIYVKGVYGTFGNTAANFTTGDDTISVNGSHGLAVGDYVQVLSAMNAYTTDNGEWSLGSSSPTDSSQPNARYSEIHRVESVPTTSSMKFSDLIVYPGYNITAPPNPIAGITRTQWRKLTMITDVTFRGIRFRNKAATSSFRGIQARSARNLSFDRCIFEASSLAGSLFKASDCYNTTFTDCSSDRDIDTISGSSWNTFLVGGGCHGTLFDNCHFVGEGQTIDFTPNNFNTTSDIGGTFDAAGSWLTSQFMKVVNCTFRNCSDAVTSHPGTYMFEFHNNTIDGGSTGVRARSKSSIITNNTIFTSRCGIALSAMVHDSLIEGNVFIQRASAAYAAWYDGVYYSAAGSEIMNLNNIKNLVIKGNTFRVTAPYTFNTGVRLGHSTVTDYAPYTDDIKNNRSMISVVDNVFYGCSVEIEKWVNGTLIQNNRFAGGSDLTHYIFCEDDSAANSIQENHFGDAAVAHIRTGVVTLTGHGYATTHRVGLQSAEVNINNTLANISDSYVHGDGVMFNGLSFTNAAILAAIRGSGAATLKLDATARDGVSGVFVDVFNGNTSTGAKMMRVYGEVRAEAFRIGTSSGPQLLSGAGTPEGVLTASVGSMYLNTSGGATTSLYMKTSGTGNTGWVAK